MKLYRIKKSKIDSKGRGLYATKDIKAGTKIINYRGKILTNREVDESNKFDNTNNREPIKTNARTTSISADKIALIPRQPSPGIPKKFSNNSEPVYKNGIAITTFVIIGIDAFFKICLNKTLNLDAPFEYAVLT